MGYERTMYRSSQLLYLLCQCRFDICQCFVLNHWISDPYRYWILFLVRFILVHLRSKTLSYYRFIIHLRAINQTPKLIHHQNYPFLSLIFSHFVYFIYTMEPLLLFLHFYFLLSFSTLMPNSQNGLLSIHSDCFLEVHILYNIFFELLWSLRLCVFLLFVLRFRRSIWLCKLCKKLWGISHICWFFWRYF